MAVIGKIRQRAGLLLIFVGLSMVAFIAGDLLTSNRPFLSGDRTTIAKIGGEKIDAQDFENMVLANIEKMKLSQNKESLDQQTIDQVRDQTWGELLNNKLINSQIKKTGLTVSSEEVFDMVQGKNVHPQIKQSFTDPNTKQFSTQSVIQFLKNMDNDQTGKTRMQWVNFENYIIQDRLQNKYYDMIKGGMYVTTQEAKQDYLNKGRSASFRYVQLNYNTIPDSSITLTDADLQKAYNENKEKFKNAEEIRTMDYIVWNVVPSAEDRTAAFQYISKLYDPFVQSTSDSLFVATNSDDPIDYSYHKKGTLSPVLDTMFSSPIGKIAGPYEENNAVKISKLIGEKMMPDSVQARHILFKVDKPEDSTAVRHVADSVYNLIKKGSKFETHVSLSQDPGSAAKGGDLGWFQPGMMVPEFNDFCFDNKKGSLGFVKTQFGYHIIEITNQSAASKQIRVATITRKIEPSTKTYQTYFAQANEFAGTNTTAQSFEKAAKDKNLNIRKAERLTENEKNLAGIEGVRPLVQWAFRAKKDEVSKAFEFADKFVVARVTGIKEKGYPPLDQVKDLVEPEARKNKKAQILIEKLNGALNGAATIDAVASKLSVSAAQADNITIASPYIANLGQEQTLVGTAFAIEKNKLSKPIKGDQGVYVIQVITINEPPATKDYSENKKQLIQQRVSRAQYETFNALKEKAKVEDFRGRFY